MSEILDDIVVTIGPRYMTSYVVDALARQPSLVARMVERNARIFLFEPDDAYEDGKEIDESIERTLAAIDTRGTAHPFYIAVIGLYRLSGRYGNQQRPLDVTPPLFGVIGLGEGGAIFLDPAMRPENSVDAVERLRVLVG